MTKRCKPPLTPTVARGRPAVDFRRIRPLFPHRREPLGHSQTVEALPLSDRKGPSDRNPLGTPRTSLTPKSKLEQLPPRQESHCRGFPGMALNAQTISDVLRRSQWERLHDTGNARVAIDSAKMGVEWLISVR
jgi:hypothetical protein